MVVYIMDTLNKIPVMQVMKKMLLKIHPFTYVLVVKINFEFKKGVGIALKSKETSS